MTKHGTILLVANGSDFALIRKAIADTATHNPLHVVHSGEEAVKYLSGQGKFSDRAAHPLPALVLLDLTVPGEGGFTVLRWLFERPGLRKKLIVIALGAAEPDSEIQLAYELGAHSCLVKPTEPGQWTQLARRVKEYWIDLNRLPESAG
mgnify:FL=1